MKLIRTQAVNYYEIICTGKVMSLEENRPLAFMLAQIESRGLDAFFADEQLKAFARGLYSSFEDDGLVNARMLTPYGKEVVRTKKAWKPLMGNFKLSIVADGRNKYIVDIKPHGDDIQGFKFQQGNNLIFTGEYENSRGMRIKDIKLDGNYFIGHTETVNLECVYDFESCKNSYLVDLDGKKIEFPENRHTFKLVDSYDANDMLRSALVNYGGFSVNGIKVVINESSGNQLFENAIKEIFELGSFDISAADGSYLIKGIRAHVLRREISKGLALKYLLKKATEKYCGYSEMTSLISEFYDLFAECADIETKTMNIYSELKQLAMTGNRTAYIRLCAYEDLLPDSIQQQYSVNTPYDFSNERMSVRDLAGHIVGSISDVKSVTMLTKYAYKNAAISRTIVLLAMSIKRQFNIPLHLITANDPTVAQSDIARDQFGMLQNDNNIVMKTRPFKDLEKIHDRYYRIETRAGDVYWKKMTGELDALKFPNDFADGKTPAPDINEDTMATVKEMTIIGVDEKGIPNQVKKEMEA